MERFPVDFLPAVESKEMVAGYYSLHKPINT